MALDLELLARRKAEQAAKEAAATPEPAVVIEDDDQWADVGLEDVDTSTKRQRTDDDDTIDGIIKNLDIPTAFKKFMKKTWVDGQRSGAEIMMRCPLPGHPDEIPSASYNPQTNLWHCHSCGQDGHKAGGDPLTIAAIGLGYDYEGGGYKEPHAFVQLRKDIAEGLGYYPKPKAPGETQQHYIAPVEAPTLPLAPPSGPKLSSPQELLTRTATVTPISAAPTYTEPEIIGEVDVDADFKYPAMPDFRKIFPEDSFIYQYLNATDKLPHPSEFNYWQSLIAIGSVLGRDVWHIGNPPVYANLYLCTVGPTGGGKSQAARIVHTLLKEVMPYDATDPNNQGLKRIPTPNSEVFLIHEMRKVIPNAVAPKTAQPDIFPVRGLVDYQELSSFMAKTKGQNGGKYEGVIIEYYDCNDEVTTGAMGTGPVVSPEPFMQLTTTTQLKSIKRLLSEDNAASGLLNRFVFSMGPTIERGFHDDMIEFDMTGAREALTRLRGFYALNRGEITYTPDGKAYSDELWEKRGRKLKKEDASELLARLDLLLKKLYLIFAANAHKKVIDKDVVQQVEHYFDYMIACYKVIGARIGLTVQGELEQRVIAAVKNYTSKNPTLPPPLATTISKNLTDKVSMKDLRAILTDLVALGVIELHPPIKIPGKPGNPGVRYSYAS
jgi:hypothetical protein